MSDTAPKFHKDRSAYRDALDAWFRKQRPEATDVVVGEIDIPVATGFSNETVFFDVDWTEGGEARHERYVGRIEPEGGALFPTQTPESAVSVGVQHRSMAAVGAASDVPVPPLLGFEADASLLGAPFFVMAFVDGVIPSDNPRYSQEGFLVDEATPADRGRMVRNGLEAMAGIHAIDWRAADLQWLDRSGDGNPTHRHQLELWRQFSMELLQGREHPVLMHALDWLDANDPQDERIGLSWGDSRLGNIIWKDYEVAAVVDWEGCAICPTEADIGWWLMFDRMSFDEMGAPRMEGFPTREEMIAIYADASGREVRDAHYWEVFATMRFCSLFVRLGDRMVGTGMVPKEMNMPVANAVTGSLAAILGIDNPTPAAY